MHTQEGLPVWSPMLNFGVFSDGLLEKKVATYWYEYPYQSY
jgi:hypothetical protein